jgi:hypothetical protein
MIERILPARIGNDYRGHKAALWLLGLFVALRLVMSANTIFNTRSVAVGADGIPLESFGAEGARTVLELFAMLGVAQGVIACLGLLALVRYRAMVPLASLLLLAEQLGRRGVALAHAAPGSGIAVPGFYINLGLLGLLLAALILSLLDTSGRQRRDA